MNAPLSLNKLYFAKPVLSLFDGEGDGGGAPPATPPLGGVGLNNPDPNTLVNVDPQAMFDQDAVNKIVQDRLAKEKKKNEDKYKELESSYQGLLANESISTEERERLQTQLEDIQKRSRTTEEQAKHEKKELVEAHENQLQEYKEAATHWEAEYKGFLVEKSLLEAAIAHDAVMPSQILSIVSEWTKLVDVLDESGKPTGKLTPMVDLPDIEADSGEPTVTQRTPMDAIERLKELQSNLFNSNAVSGVGGNSTTGGTVPGADGVIDQSKMTTEQWMEAYKKDPTKLGLRARRR